MKTCLILVVTLALLSSSAFATPLSRADKQAFMEGFYPSCASQMRKTSTMTDEQIKKWCGCTGVEAAKLLTKEDAIANNDTVINRKTNAARKICGKKLLNQSGVFK